MHVDHSRVKMLNETVTQNSWLLTVNIHCCCRCDRWYRRRCRDCHSCHRCLGDFLLYFQVSIQKSAVATALFTVMSMSLVCALVLFCKTFNVSVPIILWISRGKQNRETKRSKIDTILMIFGITYCIRNLELCDMNSRNERRQNNFACDVTSF